ncbi:MAG: M28 family peptidase [Candidatus Krumholzibacteria bacterium]|nr:M28 family peptidase [Candidatus Krumholzibacteria bacterium]
MRRRNSNSRIGTRAGLPCVFAAVLLWAASCGGPGAPAFDGESAYAFLREQCDMGARYPGSTGHLRLRRYIVEKLGEFGASVSLQPFEGVLSTGDTLRLVNIIGNFNVGASKRIMLAAHYDTRPVADMDPDPANRLTPIIGANDGASGVAVLLEIARAIGGAKPPVGVDVVFLDGEDYGESGRPWDFCLGSAWFANNLKGYRPAAAIIVDMVGDSDLKIPREGYSSAASGRLVDELFGIAARLGVKQFANEPGHTIIDDHLPFIRAGIEAADLIDFDYPYWHTVADTPDKCSPASLEAVGRVLLEYIRSR